jgi:hypothetical protein
MCIECPSTINTTQYFLGVLGHAVAVGHVIKCSDCSQDVCAGSRDDYVHNDVSARGSSL